MVYIQPRTQAKDSEAVYIQSKYRLKTQKDYKRLEQTSPVYRLYRKTPQDSRDHGDCNPVVPVMDWTEDAELHKRYIEWKEVELELGSSLSNRANSVKSNYVLRWAGKLARDFLRVYQNQSSNMKEQVQRPYYKP